MNKPKPYRHLRGKIPAFKEKPEYQERIDEKKRELLGTLDGEDANTSRLAALLVEKERAKKQLYAKYNSETNDAEYEINLYRKALSQLLENAMQNQGIEEVRLSSGELVSLKEMAILDIEDKQKAEAWALENIPEMLIVSYKGLTAVQIKKLAEWGAKMKLTINVTLNSNELKALGRDNVAQGKPVPAGMKRTLLTQAAVYGLNKTNGGDSDE